MPAKSSDADFENAIAAYVAGESCENVSARFHVGEARLRQTLKERGLFRSKTERYRISAERVSVTRLAALPLPMEEIARRYLAGESENVLAKEFDVSRNVITTRLREAGVPRRGQTAANDLWQKGRTPEQRRQGVEAAHRASHNREQTLDEKIKRAATREERQISVSPAEMLLAEWLRQRGLETIPQKAVGPYNVDLGAFPIAVEIFGGGWHATHDHARGAPERLRYLLDRGWNVVYIWVADGRRMPALKPIAADYIVAFAQRSSSDPTFRGQYRVIWGDGKEAAISGTDVNEVALIPSRRAANKARAGD